MAIQDINKARDEGERVGVSVERTCREYSPIIVRFQCYWIKRKVDLELPVIVICLGFPIGI